MRKYFFLACLGMLGQTVLAQQFELNAQLRPRLEYRHGYKTLIPDEVDAATFVSQRSRLNFGYQSDKMNAYLSLQNVRVWGDVNTLSASDKNGTALHEAWASVMLDPKFSLKMGRQEIVYDDTRIFGNVDWSQTGRSHDAFLVRYKPNGNTQLDMGLALNESTEALFETDYEVNEYKTFQYVWYHIDFKQVSLSLLALNTGFAFEHEDEQNVAYNQTIGTFVKFEKKQVKFDVSAYFQTGKIAKHDLSAFQLAGNMYYGLTPDFNLGLGVEYLSGTDMNSTSSKIKSFNPLFGTNHKFNGWMDYFYVGNHINSVGLLDFYWPLSYQKGKLTLNLTPHLFSAAAMVADNFGNEKSNALGTELDFALSYKMAETVNFHIGYSHMFATETMEVLKGGNKDRTNNWAWAMFVFKPKLFSYQN